MECSKVENSGVEWSDVEYSAELVESSGVE